MRIDYNVFNYCTKCALVFLKLVVRCPECGQRVRTKPYYSSKATGAGRIFNSKLLTAKRL